MLCFSKPLCPPSLASWPCVGLLAAKNRAKLQLPCQQVHAVSPQPLCGPPNRMRAALTPTPTPQTAAFPCVQQLAQQEDVPHVDECGICMYCIADEQPAPFKVSDLVPENFMPTDAHVKQKKPLCHHCRGCTTTLRVLVRSSRGRAGRAPATLHHSVHAPCTTSTPSVHGWMPLAVRLAVQ